MRRTAAMCAAAAAFALAAAPAAGSAARGVVIVPTGGEPPCGDPAALAEAIARDTGAAARVDREPGDGETRVRVVGDDLFVLVEITRGDDRAGTALDAPGCEAVPDAVAAFVATVLATPPPLPPAAVVGASPPVVPAAPAACGDGAPAVGSPCERAPFLPIALDAQHRQRKLYLVVSGEEVIFGGTLAGFALRDGFDDMTSADWLSLGAGATLLASGAWGFAEHDQPSGEAVAAVGGLLGLGTASFALGVAGEVRDRQGDVVLPDQRHDGMLIAGVSLYATAAITAYEFWRYPQLDPRRLADARGRVATPERRAALTPAQVVEIERELHRRRERLPTWVLTAPLWLGSALAFGDALGEEDGDERALSALAGLGLAAAAGAAHLRDVYRPGRYYQLLLGKSGIGFAASW